MAFWVDISDINFEALKVYRVSCNTPKDKPTSALRYNHFLFIPVDIAPRELMAMPVSRWERAGFQVKVPRHNITGKVLF